MSVTVDMEGEKAKYKNMNRIGLKNLIILIYKNKPNKNSV